MDIDEIMGPAHDKLSEGPFL